LDVRLNANNPVEFTAFKEFMAQMDLVITTDIKEIADIYVLKEEIGYHAYISLDRYKAKLEE